MGDRVIAETKCDTEAETAFKNVKGFTTGTFDSVKFEQERVEGAADQMAKGMEVCHQEAEAVAKTCHTAIVKSSDSAANDAKVKACETALDTAVTACDARGQEEFKKLTGKTIDRDEVKKMKDHAAEKAVGALGKTCSADVSAVLASCNEGVGLGISTLTACKTTAIAAFSACRDESNAAMATKKYGKSYADMSADDKTDLNAAITKAAGNEAVEKGKTCRSAAGSSAVEKKKCLQEEKDTYFAAKGKSKEVLDAAEIKEMEKEFRFAKEDRAEADLAEVETLCNTDVLSELKKCLGTATACESTADTAFAACEVKGKQAYEDATGDVVDAVQYKAKKERAAAKDMASTRDTCNTDAFKLTGTDKANKIRACNNDAMAKLKKTMGIKDYDETKTAGKEQALAFETKYKTLVTNQAKKKVSDLLKNTAKDAKAKAKTCKTAAADDQTEKDKCKAAEATLLDKTSRKKGVKDALKNSLGKDVTDVEVEQFIFEGAAVQVEEAMDGCMGDIDTSFAAGSQDRKDAMKVCDDEAMATFKEARMYDGFEEAALDTEIAGVDSDINTYTTDITALETTIAGMPTGTDAEKAAKATKVALKDTKVTAKASKEKEKVTKQEKKKQ